MTTALTVQCKFHIIKDKVQIFTKRMQHMEHVSADNTALGYSSLQEAEQVMSILSILQSRKGDDGKVTNQEVQAAIAIHRAQMLEATAAPDVSAGAAQAKATAETKEKTLTGCWKSQSSLRAFSPSARMS